MQAVDILHPLATIDWQECPGCDLPSQAYPSSHVVTIEDKFYISMRILDIHNGKDKHFIYSTSNTFSSWRVHNPPEGLEHFGLTSYHSQLLVVGGKERGKVTNKVWTSDNGTNWQSSLPPMPNGRVSPLATNTGPSPECVVVAGDEREDHTHLTLAVLLEGQWFTVPTTLEKWMTITYVLVHNGVAYFNVREWSQYFLVQCPVESLLAACMQSHDKSHDLRLEMQVKEIILSTGLNGYKTFGQIVTCSNQLHILYNEAMDTDSTRQFVYAGDLPKRTEAGFVTTLRTNELLIATHASSFSQWKVSKDRNLD